MKGNCKKQQKKNKQRPKGARGTEALLKGWQLNDFVVNLSEAFSILYVNPP